jgi:hypothetical protein
MTGRARGSGSRNRPCGTPGPLPVHTAVRRTIRALRAGRALIVPDRRLRAVGRMLGRAADNLAARQRTTHAHLSP